MRLHFGLHSYPGLNTCGHYRHYRFLRERGVTGAI